MIRQTVHALLACVVTFVVCAVAYPLVLWALGSALFPHQAAGSLIYGPDKTTVIGSELIAQPFASDKYFSPRPSAVDYKADAAGGSNLGTKNPDLQAKVKERAEALKATTEKPVPADLISASGSGLDPHITPEGAHFQEARVAAARQMSVEQVRSLIDRLTESDGALIGAPPRVNVLKLNLALDEEKPAPVLDTASKPTNEPQPAGGPPTAGPSAEAHPAPVSQDPAGDLAAIRTQLGEVAKQFDRLNEQLGKQADVADQEKAAQKQLLANYDQIQIKLKGLDEHFATVAEAPGRVTQLTERVGALDERVKNANASLDALRADIKGVRDTLKTIGTRPTAPAASTRAPASSR